MFASTRLLQLFVSRKLYGTEDRYKQRHREQKASRTYLYGTILKQLMPLPLMYPLNPSSCHMRTRLLHTPLYCCSDDLGCTCLYQTSRQCPQQNGETYWMIFSLSRGLTTVLEAAPAQPPAKTLVTECTIGDEKTLTDKIGCYFWRNE